MKRFSFYFRGAAIITSLGLVLSSCDNEYDLSKEINTDLTVGSYFSVPVGKTSKVELSRIIKESSTILPGENSVYEVVTSGSTSSSVNLNTVSFNITPSIGSFNISIPHISGIPQLKSTLIDAGVLSVESEPYNVKASLPKEVDKFYRASLGNANTSLKLVVSGNWPTGIDRITLRDFTIKFPKILNLGLKGGGSELKQGDIVLNAENKTFTINIPFDYADIPDDLQSTYITGEQGSKSLSINEKLSISADIEVEVSGIPQVSSVAIGFEYTSPGNVFVKNVSGVFHTDANINETIEINDIPDFLKNGSSSFTPNEVNFRLTLNNPIDIPWNLSLGFQSLKNDGMKSDNVIVGINAQPGINNILISNKQDADVVVENLPKLFEFIPDKFEINSPNDISLSSSTHTQTVDLGKEYTIDAKYDVAIPFSFSKMQIEYIDDIDELADDLFDVLDKVDTKEIVVEATAETDIPVTMKAGVKLFDTAGQPIDDGIKVDLQKFIINGEASGNVSNSPIVIKLTQVKDGYFKRLDRIEYTINADNVGSNVNLRSNQYILVKDIIAKIPNGIKVTL